MRTPDENRVILLRAECELLIANRRQLQANITNLSTAMWALQKYLRQAEKKARRLESLIARAYVPFPRRDSLLSQAIDYLAAEDERLGLNDVEIPDDVDT
jgi:multidrug resistance efflux pump